MTPADGDSASADRMSPPRDAEARSAQRGVEKKTKGRERPTVVQRLEKSELRLATERRCRLES